MAKSKYIEALEEQYTKKDAKSVLRYKAPDNKWRYVQTSKDASGGNMPSGGGMTEVTWQELKDKRDNGQLIAGSLYRITDYQCTTTQENTQSAGHQFDIVLLALSENKLAEEGWAMMHDNIYDVTFNDGITKKCYFYIPSYDDGQPTDVIIVDCNSMLGCNGLYSEGMVINESAKTVSIDESSDVLTDSIEQLAEDGIYYNYFQNSNLSAWKVWYCLDNDTARFAWAQEYKEAEFESFEFNNTIYTPSINGATGNQVQVTINGSIYYQYENISVHAQVLASKNSTNIQVGDTLYTQTGPTTTSVLGTVEKINATPAQEEGRGVIYRLIDEFNNDVAYDFKNIQFVKEIMSSEMWCYTMSNIDENQNIFDCSTNNIGYCCNNYVEKCIDDQEGTELISQNLLINPTGVSLKNCFNNMIMFWSFANLINSSDCLSEGSILRGITLISCNGFTPTSNGIYINSKKVLTEE